MIHGLLFLLIVAAGFFDAVGDSIKDLKTHFGDAGDVLGRKGHPYRDFWHACKYFSRASLIGIGLVYPMAHWDDRWAACIALACGLIVGRAVWDAAYRQPEYWLSIDNRLKLSTGWRWLDKLMGFHW